MISPLKSKPDRSFSKKIYTAIGVFLFFVFIQYFLSFYLRNFFHTISRPVWGTTKIITKPFGFIGNFFVTKNSLIEENKNLRDELTKLQLKEYDYDVLLKENDYLKNSLGRESNDKKITVSVISKPPQSPYDTYIVDAGLQEGIVAGSKVYLSDKIIVGEVKEVGFKTSVVELFSTQSKNTTVILERTGNSFVVFGQGGGNYKLDVPKDTDVLWGDIFTYPGTDSVLGSAYFIDTNSQSAFKTVYIRSPINIFTYKNFFIQE